MIANQCVGCDVVQSRHDAPVKRMYKELSQSYVTLRYVKLRYVTLHYITVELFRVANQLCTNFVQISQNEISIHSTATNRMAICIQCLLARKYDANGVIDLAANLKLDQN